MPPDDARAAYLRGMLETLIEMQTERIPTEHSSVVEQSPYKAPVSGPIPDVPKDEGSLLDARARAALKTVQELSAQAETP